MNIPVLAACFLLIFCAPHRHVGKHRASSAAVVVTCDQIKWAWEDFRTNWHQGYGSDVHRDQFVRAYPANQQKHVLECIGDE